jgi:hypothetical protein
VDRLIRFDRETPRRLTVAAIVLAFAAFSLALSEPRADRAAFFQLAAVVSSYGVLAAVVPSTRPRFDPNWLLTIGAAFVAFAVVLAAAGQMIQPN